MSHQLLFKSQLHWTSLWKDNLLDFFFLILITLLWNYFQRIINKEKKRFQHENMTLTVVNFNLLQYWLTLLESILFKLAIVK